MPGFPILRLPSVALRKILNQLDLFYLHTFSRASKSCMKVVQQIGKKYWLTLMINTSNVFNKMCLFHSNSPKLSISEVDGSLKDADGQLVPAWKLTQTSHDGEVPGMVEILNHILGTFPHIEVNLTYHHFFIDQFVLMADIFESHKANLKIIAFEMDVVNNEVFDKLTKVADKIDRFTVRNTRELSFEKIRMLTNCTELELMSTRLTNQELNEFIRNWIKGSSLRDVSINLQYQEMRYEDVMDGIETTPEMNRQSLKINEYEIVQAGGIKAELSLFRNQCFRLNVYQ